MFKFISQNISDVILIQPTIHPDSRGIFLEIYRHHKFLENGIQTGFVQQNQSISKRGVLRGMHYQLAPYEQAKLIQVPYGKIFDVAVDLRQDSKSYGKWVGVELSDQNHHMLYIPEGFAHGFLTLSDDAVVQYHCSNYYAKESEHGILWSDPQLNIQWPSVDHLIVSDKDQKLPLFNSR